MLSIYLNFFFMFIAIGLVSMYILDKVGVVDIRKTLNSIDPDRANLIGQMLNDTLSVTEKTINPLQG
jgi:hypothetical protein